MAFYQVNGGLTIGTAVALLNSSFIADYVNNFINNTQTFGIDDARQIPVVIMNKVQQKKIEGLVFEAVKTRGQVIDGCLSERNAEDELSRIQDQIDELICEVYKLQEET